jgi:hypothetical protein
VGTYKSAIACIGWTHKLSLQAYFQLAGGVKASNMLSVEAPKAEQYHLQIRTMHIHE